MALSIFAATSTNVTSRPIRANLRRIIALDAWNGNGTTGASSAHTHKSDVGGVLLNLHGSEAVREAFRQIQNAVSRSLGEAYFQGVTIQPMIAEKGYEVIVGSTVDPATGRHQILGIGRLIWSHFVNEAEFALLISDPFQGRGLGTELLARLVEIGREEKLERIVTFIHPDNADMKRISEKVGFRVHYSCEEVLKAEIDLE